MHALRTFLALAAGAWLYHFSVVLIGGVLSAVAVPPEYFQFFGRENRFAAMTLLAVVTWAMPVAILVSGGYICLWKLTPSIIVGRAKTVMLGMVAAFLYWNVFTTAVSLPEEPRAAVWRALTMTFTVPVWTSPSFIAPWLGFALAAWLAHRGQTHVLRSGA